MFSPVLVDLSSIKMASSGTPNFFATSANFSASGWFQISFVNLPKPPENKITGAHPSK